MPAPRETSATEQAPLVLLTLTAALERSADALRIAYSLNNRADVPALVSARTFLKGTPANHRPYSILHEPDGALLLTFQTPRLPPHRLVNVPILPLYSLVAEGGRYQDYAEVEVPVHELHPYARPDYPGDAPVVFVKRILFVVEYVLASQTSFLSPDPRSPDFWKTRGRPMVPLEVSLALDAPLPVLKRTDDFYRW